MLSLKINFSMKKMNVIFCIWSRTVAHYRELTLQSIKVNLFCIAVQLNPKRIHCMEDDYLKADIIC